MERVAVSVEKDFLQRVASGRPIVAITELIWNGLDEDAEEITVELHRTPLGKVDAVRIADNGSGIPRTHATTAFGKLGASWKLHASRTKRRKRSLHGKTGKGRFSAFSLGECATWTTRYEEAGKGVLQYAIRGDTADWGAFSIGDPEPTTAGAGTDVHISEISRSLDVLATPSSAHYLTEHFALYLHDFKNIKIVYDGKRIDPEEAQEHYRTYRLAPVEIDGENKYATLVIIEWKMPVERAMHLCNEDGISLSDVAPNIQAKGYNFTAYLKSEYFQELHEVNALSLESLHPGLRRFLDHAREQLREHFRKRTLERASLVLDEWKSLDLYPYSGPPETAIEQAEREVFDICALQIHDYAPGFQSTEHKSKKLSLYLLRQALEQNPSSVKSIFSEILKLPRERQDDLRELVEVSRLAGVISAAKKVTDRLLFLEMLETLLFHPESRKVFRERPNLHKMVEANTWIFGEEFHLTGSDSGLTQVLRKHEHLMGRPSDSKKPVTTAEGGRAIVDIALGRKVSTSRADENDYLIVELKRPKVPITMKVYDQIMKYGRAIATDERFRAPSARWTFWAVSNDLDPQIEGLTSQPGKPRGFLSVEPNLQITYCALPWRTIINECKQRLKIFRDELNVSIAQPGMLDKLRKTYGKYLPVGTDAIVEDLASTAE